MKTFKLLILAATFSLIAAAQTLVGPSPVTGFRLRYQGQAVTSGTSYYYWVQAIYPSGVSALVGGITASVNTLGPTDSDNIVALGWNAIPNAYYNVLKTTTSSTPTGSCTCALSLNRTANSLDDVGQTLTAYVVPPGDTAGFYNFATATGTATLGAVVGQFITGTPVAAATYTTPTATAIEAAMPSCVIGAVYHMVIYNTSGGANTITLAGGTSVTIVGTATVAQNNGKQFLITPTNCSTPAVSIYSLGTSTF